MSRGIDLLKESIESCIRDVKDGVMAIVERLIDEAKQAGYDEGYNDGYAQGKIDGGVEARRELDKPEKVEFT